MATLNCSKKQNLVPTTILLQKSYVKLSPGECFEAVVTPVHEIAEEDVVGVGHGATRAKQLFEVVKLKAVQIVLNSVAQENC